MKATIAKTLTLACLVCWGSIPARAQGTFTYDQQSSDESNFGSGGNGIQANQIIGQSFVPTLDGVGFVRLVVYDGVQNNSLGATVYINLRSNAINGPVISSTAPVSLPDNFGRGSNGVVNFYFPNTVAVTPGLTYYFQPVVQSGDAWGVSLYNTFNYAAGTAYSQGSPVIGFDLWFREGVIAPEPSALSLALVFGIGLFAVRRLRISASDLTRY